MSKEKDKFEGLDDRGPGVNPIPVPDNSVSSTDMLTEVVDVLLNPPKEDQQNKNQRQEQADVSNRTEDK